MPMHGMLAETSAEDGAVCEDDSEKHCTSAL